MSNQSHLGKVETFMHTYVHTYMHTQEIECESRGPGEQGGKEGGREERKERERTPGIFCSMYFINQWFSQCSSLLEAKASPGSLLKRQILGSYSMLTKS